MELFSYILFQFVHCWCIGYCFLKVDFVSCYIAKAVHSVYKFWGRFFGSLRYRIMSCANRDTSTISLPIYSPFISSCLISVARNSRTMLHRSGDSRNPCLIPDFRGNCFTFSPLSMMLAICSLYNVDVIS
jgi:hypothetical protein